MTAWDSKDIDGFVDHFALDATWKINTSPLVQGKEGLKGLTELVMNLAKSSRHFDLREFVSGKTICVHGSVEYSYEAEDKPNVVCTFCDVFEMNDEGKIQAAVTYMDTSPTMA